MGSRDPVSDLLLITPPDGRAPARRSSGFLFGLPDSYTGGLAHPWDGFASRLSEPILYGCPVVPIEQGRERMRAVFGLRGGPRAPDATGSTSTP